MLSKSPGMVLVTVLITLLTGFESRAAELTVATYNVNFGNPDLEKVVDVIRQADADVVALQEINDESARYLERELEGEYPHIALQPDTWAKGYAFLSRVPLQDVEYEGPNHGDFGVYYATVEVGDMSVRVANVHLRPNIPERGEAVDDFLMRVMTNERTRIAELDDIMARLDEHSEKGAARMIAGDLNTVAGLGALSHLSENGFVDAFAELEDPSAHPTWHWRARGRTWQFRLDYILAEPSLRPVSAEVVANRKASDHYLVKVGFELSTREE